MRSGHRRAALALCVLAVLPWALHGDAPAARGTYAAEIARLSEPGGAFDTDNLISNEASYLRAVPALIANGVRGGAYLGVGPDQNFSYIAQIRPSVAYIIDIRRDNLLLHLLFKGLFAESRSRADYLSLLTGRSIPSALRHASVEEIVRHVDSASALPDKVDAIRARLDRTIGGFGVPLSQADLSTIDRFHRTFVDHGLDLVFESHGASRRAYYAGSRYPSFRQLLLATDPDGRRLNYLASEDDFQFLKRLQAADGIIPVVGDVSGPRALTAIGATVSARRERVSAFYISNVEFYLARNGSFGRFVNNLAQLPHDEHSVMIRSVFGAGASRTLVQPIRQTLLEASRERP